MASRFVSGGTIAGDDSVTGDEGSHEGVPKETGTAKEGERVANATSVEWEAVQKDLDEERRRRAEARKRDVEGGTGGERSLYEILQANKAAKQAAFEEQNRIRNQFRALDDDEIDFLHGVSDEQHAEEERVRRETEEGLASFRKAQKGSGAAGIDDADVDGNGDDLVEEWGAAPGRKRKREKEKAALKGVKRRTSMPEEDKKDERKDDVISASENTGNDPANSTRTKLTPTPTNPEPVAAKDASTAAPPQLVNTASMAKARPALGLVDYGSDEDDDD
ncbi:hypothetical protein E0Z10_g10874 [Xylaria hypoxylon]|uniref:FAM192A/Fyv6 N-terminal domain-containing protein n=1 Tax=Xylaria hypoxylon TaxID=37992 RepID=A0A4Z0YC90_9PEZI|nr:hypothetical protein E0Z10_g10874 [Xylaria hypoxylon]